MSNEINSVKPKVYIGTGYPSITATDESAYLYCLRIVDNFGIEPSSCMLRYIPQNETYGLTDNITLSSGTLKHNQRVIVVDADTALIYFHGWIKKRMDQGSPAVSIWTALDDRILLRNIPIRGCIVRDVDDEARFSATIPTIMNPGGRWNCIGKDIGGTVYPVFSQTATFGRAYEAPDEAFPSDLSTTKVSPWTPRRALQYLRLVAYYKEIFGVDRLDGMTGEVENYLISEIISWESNTISTMVGKDDSITDTVDPLDKKLPQIDLQGQSLLSALNLVLRSAGTHDLDLFYDESQPSITAGVTQMRFRPIGVSATGAGKVLKMQTSGTADTTWGNIYDFALNEDSTETASVCICEGEPVKIETQLAYNSASPSTSTLVPAWSAAEQAAFLKCIFGKTTLSGDPGTYAIAPTIHGKPDGSFANCDGTGGLPIVWPMTPEAITVARQNFPTVFRAWRMVARGDVAAALVEPTSANGYLKGSRPIYPEQLQFFTWLSDELGDERLRANLPIRVSIYFDAIRDYDVPRDVSIRVTENEQGDNLLWLEGIAEGADGLIDCVYDGSLLHIPDIVGSKIALKDRVRINCAFPSDYRTQGVATYSSTTRDNSIESAFGGVGQLVYLDEPGSFREHIQYKSKPGLSQTYYGGAAGTTAEGTDGELSRILPPGSEYQHATYAAQREMIRRKHPKRTSSWMRAGIDFDIQAGDWIDRVYLYNVTEAIPNPTPSVYTINSGVGTVTLDFLEQRTMIGDTFGDI